MALRHLPNGRGRQHHYWRHRFRKRNRRIGLRRNRDLRCHVGDGDLRKLHRDRFNADGIGRQSTSRHRAFSGCDEQHRGWYGRRARQRHYQLRFDGRGYDGVRVAADAATGNAIIGNSIYQRSGYNSGGLGIDLGSGGVTVNDNLDPDSGPNNLQNFPVISSTTVNGAGTAVTVSGSINTLASLTGVVIHFYSTPSTGDLGKREAKKYLGSTTVNTNASGNATFTNVNLTGYSGPLPQVKSSRPRQLLTTTLPSFRKQSSRLSAPEIPHPALTKPSPRPTADLP